MSDSSGLSPPPPLRHRASSTSFTPLTFLSSPFPSRCNSKPPQSSTPDPPPPLAQLQIQPSPQPKPMLVLFASRLLHFLHVQQKLPWSPPASPRSSSEHSVLPLSSPHHSSFHHVFDDPIPTTSHSRWLRLLSSIHTPILIVIMLFPLSTALVLFSLSTLPISISWPRTLTDLAQLGRELHGYSQSGPGPLAHVVAVMSITAVWKHAWSIPGSVLWNVLAGALFSPAFATILLTALTMIGSACATLLSTPLAPLLTHFFPRALDMTRSALEGDSKDDPANRSASNSSSSSAWVRLSVLRLIGVVPWSGINIACGVCGVAISDCMLGAFIGTFPWTAVTCQIGDILQTVASTPSPTPQTISSLLTSPTLILKLVLLSFLSLAPILARDRLRALISHTPSSTASSTTADAQKERSSHRWEWAKIRLPSRERRSRSTTRKGSDDNELAVLVDEKDAARLQSEGAP